jgi:hypothetical protein
VEEEWSDIRSRFIWYTLAGRLVVSQGESERCGKRKEKLTLPEIGPQPSGV